MASPGVERLWYVCRRRLRSLFRRATVDRELDDELGYHIDRQVAEHIARGMSPGGARAAALRAMGGLTQRREECRDARRMTTLDDLGRGICYAVRILRRSPGFTIAAVLSLALAMIGLGLSIGAGLSLLTSTFASAMIVKESLVMAATGITMGVPASLLASRSTSSGLYGVSPSDPIILAGATGVMLLVACLAALLPALRASRIAPTLALRSE